MPVDDQEHGPAVGPSADQDTSGLDRSRRDFFKRAGATGALATAASLGLGGLVLPAGVAAAGVGPLKAGTRRVRVFRARVRAARSHLLEKTALPLGNGDEERYTDKRASFSKSLPHDGLGEVDASAYAALLLALGSGDWADFEAIPLASGAERRLANPQAAYAMDMTGMDSHATPLEPPPAFASAEAAAEAGEVYWLALTRDIPYRHWTTDSLIDNAVADLNGFSATVGPKENGLVTPATLFRGEAAGALIGPYLSQFFWLDVPYGPMSIEQKYAAPLPGSDFMTSYDEWLAMQRGAEPVATIIAEAAPTYIRNNRALGDYVHMDAVFQAYLNAALIMAGLGPDALDRDNPYLGSGTQYGFVTFGIAHILDLVTKAARIGLEGAWFHKWLVHRRLRPEVYAARVENQLNGSKPYGLHPDVLGSAAVAEVLQRNGNRLLPQAFPEGSPTHPSYPAGHASLSGACATVLKAVFDEDFVIPDPVQASEDGLLLEPWTGPDLTLGNEVDKLATNIAIARCAAGVHYRSDNRGLRVGEAQAIGMLRDYSLTYSEAFDGFTLTRFDGTRIRIVDGDVMPA